MLLTAPALIAQIPHKRQRQETYLEAGKIFQRTVVCNACQLHSTCKEEVVLTYPFEKDVADVEAVEDPRPVGVR